MAISYFAHFPQIVTTPPMLEEKRSWVGAGLGIGSLLTLTCRKTDHRGLRKTKIEKKLFLNNVWNFVRSAGKHICGRFCICSRLASPDGLLTIRLSS